MEAIVGDLTSRGYGTVLWEPDDKTVRDARVTRFMTWLAGRGTLRPSGYQDLWHWSVTDPAAFWSAVWDYFGVLGDRGDGPVLDGQVMPDVQWFGGARSLAVASGRGPAAGLRDAGADAGLPDLTDTAAVVALVARLTEPSLRP